MGGGWTAHRRRPWAVVAGAAPSTTRRRRCDAKRGEDEMHSFLLQYLGIDC
jgi:hypothetical protein